MPHHHHCYYHQHRHCISLGSPEKHPVGGSRAEGVLLHPKCQVTVSGPMCVAPLNLPVSDTWGHISSALVSPEERTSPVVGLSPFELQK